MNRRNFIATSLAGFAAGSLVKAERIPVRKAVLLDMLPKSMSLPDRFQMAKDAGFEEIECPTALDQAQADAFLAASKASKVRIHSVMNQAHWQSPLSSADPAVVDKGMSGMETSLRNAHLWGADTVLLVPAVVNAQTPYKDAWERSQKNIRKLIPLAEELKVTIAIEEVWNKFLLSPIEFARYIDDFQSPRVRAYFDVGNVVINGYPQDWIRTLGPRIVKLHIKDFRFKDDPTIRKRVADWVMIREGEIDWKEVHKALGEIGYHGSATVELPGGDLAYLKDVSHRFDLILEGT